MPGVPRARRMEGWVDNGRRPEVALPLLRQEVHLPHRHRPRALPQAARYLGLLHQAHATTSPSSARPSCAASRTRWPSSGGAACSPRCPANGTGSCCATPSGENETYVNDTDLSKGYGQARKCGLFHQKLGICDAIDVHKNPVAVV